MKIRFFIALPCVALHAYLQGQSSLQIINHKESASLLPNQVIYTNTEPYGNNKVTLDIKNTSSSTKTYVAKRFDVLLNSNATSTAVAYFCIAGYCYGNDIYVSPNPLTLDGGQSASELDGPFQMLIADLDEASQIGESHVRYTFQNVSNAADSVQISIKYNTAPPTNTNTGTTGISEKTASQISFKLSPNPAREMVSLTIDAECSAWVKVKLNDIFGRTIWSREIELSAGSNQSQIDLSGVSEGIYTMELIEKAQVRNQKIILH